MDIHSVSRVVIPKRSRYFRTNKLRLTVAQNNTQLTKFFFLKQLNLTHANLLLGKKLPPSLYGCADTEERFFPQQ